MVQVASQNGGSDFGDPFFRQRRQRNARSLRAGWYQISQRLEFQRMNSESEPEETTFSCNNFQDITYLRRCGRRARIVPK